MRRNSFFKKFNESDDTIIDIDIDQQKSTDSNNEPKYVYYPSQKKNESAIHSTSTSQGIHVTKPAPSIHNIEAPKVLAPQPKPAIKPTFNKDIKPIVKPVIKPIDLTLNKKEDYKNVEKVVEKKSELKVKMEEDKKYNDEELLFNLKIISELNSSDKLSFSEEKFSIDNPTYLQGMYRWWSGEDRAKTLEHLNRIIDNTFDYMDKTFTNTLQTVGNSTREEKILYENNSQVLQKFYIALIDATKGLDKLKSTYSYDKSMTTGLDLLISKIRIRTDKINDILRIGPTTL
jgi:hypothetical protein